MFTHTDSEAIVVGAGLGGLAAGMRLGAKGYHVTVIDRLDRAGGRGSSITKGPYRFDLGPTILTAPFVFEELWQACGRNLKDDLKITPLDPFYEIRWPDGASFKARSDTEAMREEVARLSPSDVTEYERFLKDAYRRYVVGFEGMVAKPMHRLWETIRVLPEFAMLRADRSILGLAKRRVRDPRLRMALSFHPLFIGGDPRHVTSMYALVSHLEKEHGVHCIHGGVQAMADAMVKVIRQQGGVVRLGEEVKSIDQAKGHASGVTLKNGESLRAKMVVTNADPGQTYKKLMKGKKRWSATKLDRARWSMGLFVWYFATKGTAGNWADVGHHTILSGPRYEGLLKDIFIKGKLADDMSLYLHRPAVTDPTVAPNGDDVFYALSPVPHLGHDNPVNWAAEKDRYRAKVAAVLDQTIPGFHQSLVEEVVFTPEDFKDRYLAPFGSGFSLEPRILQSAWFRPHNVSEELPGLFAAGAGTHPGAGLPGVVSSAKVLDSLIPDAPARPEQRMAAE